MKVCPKCGNLVADNLNFCTKCGTSVQYYIGGYEFFFGDQEILGQSTDPLGLYSQLGYWKIPEENIKWLCENIYNIEYEPIAEDEVCDSQMHYVHDGYFYHRDPAFGDAGWYEAEIVKYNVVDGKYEIVVENYSCFEDWDENGELNRDLHATAKITAEIKIIDGERYWSIYKIEEYDPSTDTQQTTEQTVDKLSADDIINVYMNNKSVWYRNFENFECDGYSSFYSFIDLDFDGIPELLTTGMGGTGRYSSNKFYKLNANKDGIEEITYNADSESMYDFYSPEVRPQLLKNSQNNSYLYWGSDFINAGRYGSGFTYGKLEYKGGKITQTEMFSTGSSFEGGVESTYYDLIEGSDYNDVSESEYNREYNAFMADYTNVNLQMEYISAQEFAGASQSQQKELFKNALKAYNYNGYVSLVE